MRIIKSEYFNQCPLLFYKNRPISFIIQNRNLTFWLKGEGLSGELFVLLEGTAILIGVLFFFFLSRIPIKRRKFKKTSAKIK